MDTQEENFSGPPGCGEVGYSGRATSSQCFGSDSSKRRLFRGVSPPPTHPPHPPPLGRLPPTRGREEGRILLVLETEGGVSESGHYDSGRPSTWQRGREGGGGGGLLIRACGISCSYHRTVSVLPLMAAVHQTATVTHNCHPRVLGGDGEKEGEVTWFTLLIKRKVDFY